MAGLISTEGPKLLGNLVNKLLSNNARFAGVEYRVLAPSGRGQTLIIELTKGRASRQVMVDSPTIQRLAISRQADAGLIRELRIAILYVMRLSEKSR